MVTAIGVDSDLLKRGPLDQFIGDMGLAVLSSTVDLLSKYDEALDPVLRKYRIRRDERMVNLYSLKRNYSKAVARQVVRDFLRNMMTEISEVTFCYSVFPTRKIPFTWIYTQDPKRNKISIVDFVKMIQAGYALFVAHYHKVVYGGEAAVMLDNFDFPITRAWQELNLREDLGVYMKGDLCNPRISLADLLLDLVECDIWRLDFANATSTLRNLCPGVRIAPPKCLIDIDIMRPLARTQTDTSSRLAHPIIFLVKEGLPGEGEMIESSPLMYAARNMACELGGCTKIFEPGPSDQRLIGKGTDYFVYKGPVGKGVIKGLRTSGHDVTEWNQHELLSKYSLRK